jgi:KUP system potassium uptake protein
VFTARATVSLLAQFQLTSFIFTGGTFALYSLLCRHAKVSTIPNQHKTDEELTTYSRQTYEENSLAAKVKRWLERHAYRKNCLLILVLIGTCTAIGDGILTPAISGIERQFFCKQYNWNLDPNFSVCVLQFSLLQVE